MEHNTTLAEVQIRCRAHRTTHEVYYTVEHKGGVRVCASLGEAVKQARELMLFLSAAAFCQV